MNISDTYFSVEFSPQLPTALAERITTYEALFTESDREKNYEIFWVVLESRK